MSTSATSAAAAATAAANAQLQQAANSILSGVTNSTLDTSTLVSALVTAKTAGQAQTIANNVTNDNTTLSALGTMQAALSGLQNSLTTPSGANLSDGSIFNQLGATMSGSGITATTSTGAAAGSYAVTVTQIATANQISSQAFASNATLGTGNVTIGVGSKSMTIALTSSNNTLSGLAAAINSSTSNPGVTASVVNAADGQHLVLTSTQTGAANTVTVAGGAGVNAGLATANFTQVTTAQDAKLTISGNPVTSASNSVSSALTGVTLNLTSAAVGTTQTLSVATNTSAITTAVQTFVTNYNAWISAEQSLSSFNSTAPSGSQAAPLLGDSMLNSAVNGIASIVSGGVTVGGTTYNLAQIGVNLNHDGTLSFNSATLQSTLVSSPGTVSALFNGTNGFGAQLNNFVNSYTASTTGQIAQRESTLNADLTTQQQAQTTLAAFQASLTAQYQAEFTQLNTIMSNTQSNISYMNQLFGGNGTAGTINGKS